MFNSSIINFIDYMENRSYEDTSIPIGEFDPNNIKKECYDPVDAPLPFWMHHSRHSDETDLYDLIKDKEEYDLIAEYYRGVPLGSMRGKTINELRLKFYNVMQKEEEYLHPPTNKRGYCVSGRLNACNYQFNMMVKEYCLPYLLRPKKCTLDYCAYEDKIPEHRDAETPVVYVCGEYVCAADITEQNHQATLCNSCGYKVCVCDCYTDSEDEDEEHDLEMGKKYVCNDCRDNKEQQTYLIMRL